MARRGRVTVGEILERLERVHRNGVGWVARCPAHDDDTPSLSVAEGDDGRVLLNCHAGCATDAIVAEIGITVADLFPPRGPEPEQVYPYVDERGNVLFEVVRRPGKKFVQRRTVNGEHVYRLGNTRRVLYRLPAVLDAAVAGATIYVVEGEKDVHAVERVGAVATCNPGGAGKWRSGYAEVLAGADVVIVADRDDAGIVHARTIAATLPAESVRIVQAAEGKDAHDHITGGHSLDEFVPLADIERATAAKATGERMVITTIADVTAKRVDWLEPDMVARGMLTGLVAPGGTVKGLYGIHLAAKIAERGERTLFLCSEDALDYIIRPRFDAAGCDGKLAFALSIDGAKGARSLHFPSDLRVLEEALAKVEPHLTIIDPVASYIDPGLDMAKNNQMREILQPLIGLAAEANVAIVPVYHLGKNPGRGAIGTVAFEDACRQVLTAARDDEDEDIRYLELTKSNIGRTGYGRKLRIVEVPLTIDGEPVGVAKLVDEGRANKSVHTLLDKKGPPGPEPEKRELARSALVDALIAAGTKGTNADATKKEIAEAAGVSPSTIWRAFDELKKDNLAAAEATRNEHGTIIEWRWVAKLALLVGRGDA